jgi:BirA family biotin operon repressor/biotin-[acetyl-CoA-carboxylase] ligase
MKIWLRSTGSTMKDAAALAARGEPHGTVVVAEEQTAGIGRHGHFWHSESHGGLYLSIILRPNLPPNSLPVLTMALGIAAHKAVTDVTAVDCDLRWPNDLMLNKRKIAGALVQSADSALIAGVGMNVNQTDFPERLAGIATSLCIETGREFSKETLFEAVLANALDYTRCLEEQGVAPILVEFGARSSYVKGKLVEVALDGRNIEGVTAGLDEHGFLRVQTATGVETILAGGVRERS